MLKKPHMEAARCLKKKKLNVGNVGNIGNVPKLIY